MNEEEKGIFKELRGKWIELQVRGLKNGHEQEIEKGLFLGIRVGVPYLRTLRDGKSYTLWAYPNNLLYETVEYKKDYILVKKFLSNGEEFFVEREEIIRSKNDDTGE